MKYLGRYISRLLGRSLTRAFITFPSCAIDYAVAWYKNLNARSKTYEVPDIIEGLLDFDGSDDSVSFSSSPDISGSKVITFNMYFSSGTANGAVLLLTNGVSNDCLYIYRSNTVISLFCKRGSSGTNCKGVTGSLTSYLSTVMSFVVTKDTEEIISLSINGDNIPLILSGDFFSNSGEVFTVGSFSSVSEIENTLIWNLNIGGTSAYLGQPNGNQNSAWVDTIGSINGVVNGSPTTTSIDLGGTKTVYCIDDAIGTRDDTVFFGQYLTTASGQINLYRSSGTYDYIDPSTGNSVNGNSIPANGLISVPANGICDIGIYPKTSGTLNGVALFDGSTSDNVTLSAIPDVTGTKNISFYFRIDSPYTIASYLIQFGTGSDYCNVVYSSTESKLVIQCGSSDSGRSALDIVLGTVYKIEISKTTGTTTSIKLNGISQTIGGSLIGISPSSGNTIGHLGTSTRYTNGVIADVLVEGTHYFKGYPSGDTSSSWDDSIGSITATVNGSPTTTNIDTGETLSYDSFYPVCERAGTVLHDVMQDSIHISVATPTWDETLYGSDYLNQYGYVDKADFDALVYDWETLVDGSEITLDDDTLVPLAQWDYQNLQDNTGENILDSSGEQIQVKVNI